MCVVTHITDVEGVGHRCMCDTEYKLGEDLKSCTRKYRVVHLYLATAFLFPPELTFNLSLKLQF